MSDQLINDLIVLSSLVPGTTLSTQGRQGLSIMYHDSFSSAIWRRYAGEDKGKTLIHIKSIFFDALMKMREVPCQYLKDNILAAINGVLSLKETYANTDIVEEVERIRNYVVNEVNSISIIDSSSSESIIECDMSFMYCGSAPTLNNIESSTCTSNNNTVLIPREEPLTSNTSEVVEFSTNGVKSEIALNIVEEYTGGSPYEVTNDSDEKECPISYITPYEELDLRKYMGLARDFRGWGKNS